MVYPHILQRTFTLLAAVKLRHQLRLELTLEARGLSRQLLRGSFKGTQFLALQCASAERAATVSDMRGMRYDPLGTSATHRLFQRDLIAPQRLLLHLELILRPGPRALCVTKRNVLAYAHLPYIYDAQAYMRMRAYAYVYVYMLASKPQHSSCYTLNA